MSIRPAEHVSPMLDRAAEPDSPHGADMDMDYRSQTNAMAYRCSMATHSWAWAAGRIWPPQAVAFGIGPLASISAKDTWTAFQIGVTSYSHQFGLPWLFTVSAEQILFYTQVIAPVGIPLQVRWESETLLDAVATVTGGEPNAPASPREEPPSMNWAALTAASSGGWKSTSCYSWLEPTVPANRRVLLTPKVKTPDEYKSRFDANMTAEVHIASVTIMDVPNRNLWGY